MAAMPQPNGNAKKIARQILGKQPQRNKKPKQPAFQMNFEDIKADDSQVGSLYP